MPVGAHGGYGCLMNNIVIEERAKSDDSKHQKSTSIIQVEDCQECRTQ